MNSLEHTLQQAFQLAVPEVALVGVACVLFLLGTARGVNRHLAGFIALGGLAIAAISHFTALPRVPGIETVTPLLGDKFAMFVRMAAFATGAALVLFAWNECDDRRSSDYMACLLIATAGSSLVGTANDLIFLFLALELVSIPTYVMLYLPGLQSKKGQEAVVKYFMLSVMSSAMLLFGFSYIYGLTGTTNLAAIQEILPRLVAGSESTTAIIAIVFVTAGLGFRITAFPFHFYAPDVYEGGPTGTVAFLAFVPKVSGFAALLKLFAFLGSAHAVANEFVKQAMMLFWILSAITMTAGNVMGLLQNNLKRMLAYSGVANAGYMLIGLAVMPTQAYRGIDEAVVATGPEAIMFYLLAYGAMTIGTLTVISHLHSPNRPVETVDDVAGLRETHPYSAALLGIFLLSMIGLPLTAGFAGKFLLFMSALAAPAAAPMRDLFVALAVIGAVNAAIGAYYYLRVINAMFLRTSLSAPTPRRTAGPLWVTAIICAVFTVAFGVYPLPMINLSRAAVGGL
ncbi:NADH-quinone oxidoreductase subunit N [Zavarzinella formosa]|uniref:NADH-quinone oxidoreductase subunit N n=1 Tax=Zavarzinella formosa TaxID=360055 RepID=UPI0002FC6ED8|nr:NADH-quinone oxidoreductase subunit N [Zavarzinella formosa]